MKKPANAKCVIVGQTCKKCIQEESKKKKNPCTCKLVNYGDNNYTDYEICDYCIKNNYDHSSDESKNEYITSRESEFDDVIKDTDYEPDDEQDKNFLYNKQLCC